MTVASQGGSNNEEDDRHLLLDYLRATPGVLRALATVLVALTGLLALILR